MQRIIPYGPCLFKKKAKPGKIVRGRAEVGFRVRRSGTCGAGFRAFGF